MTEIAVMALALAAVSLLRHRITSWPITSPILFVGAGLALGPHWLNIVSLELDDESIVLAAELTLAMLLFSDAARINTMALRKSYHLPARLLGIGLPLSIAFGTVVTRLVLPELSWSQAALVSAILAPTDAALGQAVVSSKRVPVAIRQSLNVEAGLNDGLVVPVVALFAVISAGEEIESVGSLITETFTEIALGFVIGVVAGALIGYATRWARDSGWSDSEGLRLVTFGGAVAGFAGAAAIGGNGFIAAFVAGVVLHVISGEQACNQAELTEAMGEVGASATFFIFGALLVVPALEATGLAVVLLAFCVLTFGRMIPVAIATMGSGLKVRSQLFLGWFGPRGLASMLFGLLLVGERGESVDKLFAVITIVVLASIVLHGITASPGARRYGDWYDAHPSPTGKTESKKVHELRLRGNRS